jgi:hypothetical protein
MDEHLDGLYAHCHPILKRLKMGDEGMITCTKEYNAEEIELYSRAYAGHKKKWFETSYDKALDVVRVKRGPIPDWEIKEEIDTEEEL